MKVTIRRVTVLPTLMHWRREVLENVFGIKPPKALLLANRRYYEARIADGSHIAIVAESDSGDDIGCGAICLGDELPSPDNISGRCAYLMNIYVRRPWRRHGVGGEIVKWLVDKARELGCDKIYLETTPQARSLYSEIGFEDLKGMMKYAEIQDR